MSKEGVIEDLLVLLGMSKSLLVSPHCSMTPPLVWSSGHLVSKALDTGCPHEPACIAFHGSHLYITNPGSVSHFAKTYVSLQTTTYKSKNTKCFGINLLLT